MDKKQSNQLDLAIEDVKNGRVKQITNTPSYPLLRSANLNIVPLIWHDVAGVMPFSVANQDLYPTEFAGAYNNLQGATSHDSGSPLLFKDSTTGNYIILKNVVKN